MAIGTRTVEISLHVYELACRGAALDRLDVVRYLESMVARDAEHIKARELVEGVPPLRRAEHADQASRLAA